MGVVLHDSCIYNSLAFIGLHSDHIPVDICGGDFGWLRGVCLLSVCGRFYCLCSIDSNDLDVESSELCN